MNYDETEKKMEQRGEYDEEPGGVKILRENEDKIAGLRDTKRLIWEEHEMWEEYEDNMWDKGRVLRQNKVCQVVRRLEESLFIPDSIQRCF